MSVLVTRSMPGSPRDSSFTRSPERMRRTGSVTVPLIFPVRVRPGPAAWACRGAADSALGAVAGGAAGGVVGAGDDAAGGGAGGGPWPMTMLPAVIATTAAANNNVTRIQRVMAA